MEIPYNVKPRPDTGLYNAKVGIWLFLASEVMLFGALFSTYILLRVGAPEGTWPKPHTLLDVPLGTFNTLVLIVSSVTVVLSWAALKMNQFKRFRIYQAVTLLLALTFLVVKSFEYTDKFTHYQVTQKDGTVIDGHLVERTADSIIIDGMVMPVKADEYKLHHHPSQQGHGGGGSGHESHGEHGAHAGPQVHGAAGGDHGASGEAAQEGGGEHHHEEIEIARAEIAEMVNYGPWFNTYFAIYFTMTGLHALHVFGGALVIGYLWGPGAKMWRTEPERFTNRVEVSGLFWHFVDLVWIFLFPVFYLL